MFRKIALKNKKLAITTLLSLILFSASKLFLAELIRIDLKNAENSMNIHFFSLILLNVAVLCMMLFINYFSTKETEKFLAHSKHMLNQMLFSKLTNRNNVNEIENMKIISMFNNDIPVILNNYISVIISIIYFVFSCVIGFIYIGSMNIWISLYISGVSVAILFSTKWFTRKLSGIQKELNSSLEDISSIINNFMKNNTLFKVFNLDSKLREEFSLANDDHKDIFYKTNITSRYSELANDLGGWIIICGLYLLGIFLMEIGQINFSDLVASAQASSMVTTPIFWLSKTISSLSKSKIVREEFINYTSEEIITEEIEMKNIVHIDNIKFKNIQFSYNAHELLSNFNFEIEKGKKYAIIGKSGSGKSTIMKLILKLVDNYEGSIEINGNDIKGIRNGSIYSSISYAGQENYLLNDSIKNNITMYSLFEKRKFEDIIKLLALDDLIAENGLDYIIKENLSNISGGERQRINIARALYKNSNFLIMDEAFSSLDMNESKRIEREILNRFDTVISIIHKYDDEILKNYDYIINFDYYPEVVIDYENDTILTIEKT